MFPYLRSQVTLMTTQPNITPVIIPPININSFLKRQQEEFNKN
jgi:preprotein translocase subunit SecB